jgi:putative heme-binding domain-containing protein
MRMHRLLSLLTLGLLFTLSARAEPVSLFDGRTLDGWIFDAAVWRVEDGCITGGSTTEKIPKNFFIHTQRSFQNFELKLKIKCSGDPKTGMINSGIQIHSLPDGGAMSGYQIDCGAGWFGKIYDEHRRNKVIWSPTPEQQAALDKVVEVFGWNDYVIRAEGPRLRTWINGVLCIDYTETDPNIALDGHIAPQVHSGGACLVQVKDITIEELPPTPGVPTWQSIGGLEGMKARLPPKPTTKKAAPKRDISYNNVQGSALTAEQQLKKFQLPEGYEIELVVQESAGLGKFVSVYFDHRGRMWTQTALEYPIDANENPAAAEAVYAGKGRDRVLVYPRESLNGKIPAQGLTNPTVFADGLAIPLGILPWGAGDTCYVQHGHDLKLYKDTNGDGKADRFDVVLTGFGVQDSHLFPHQFTRAPGGWIWMAQGLFNHSQVRRPGSDQVVDWPKCSMARLRPDGREFEVISTGPNNIWGLVITGAGEAFIQEANDYGYPVMPFHEYAYYPGGMEALKKSYQPDFPPQAEFRMGGTGLSGLALIESGPLSPKVASASAESSKPSAEAEATYVVAVANPITSKIQTLAMHRDGAYWKLAQLPDFVTCADPFFRPVALTNGPDGCLYIVDWYNKIISHNEVPRAHPDRDKTRGRIWRVRTKAAKAEVADFTQQSREELTAMLDQAPIGRAHLAWQELQDRGQLPTEHWAGREYLADSTFGKITRLGRQLTADNLPELLAFARPSLPGPLTQSSRGPKQIPVREAYDREFERFLVRLFLERHPDLVATFLDSDAAAQLPVEARVLASLALEPRTSASRVAKLLPQLDRAPNDEELLRLAQFPEEPGVGEALQALLTNEKSRAAVAEKLLAQRTKLEEKKIAPLLIATARTMLRSADALVRRQALSLVGGFQLGEMESVLVRALSDDKVDRIDVLKVLRDLRSSEADLFASLAKSDPNPLTRKAALEALAASRAPDAGAKLLVLYPGLQPSERRNALNALSSTKAGASAIVAALLDQSLPQADLDGPTVERLATVLGDDPALEKLQQQLGGVFREVLLLDGQNSAWVDSKITLDGPFTVEAWVRLAPGIGNEDCLLGVPNGLQLNFFGGKFRVYAGPELHDVCVANKPMTPDLWTHLAVTRDAEGICRIYQNGELDATATRPAPATWENCRIGWSGPAKGTEGAIMEFRVLPRAKTATEIRSGFDRTQPTDRADLTNPQKLGQGARLAKTIDTPPLLTAEQAQALDAKFQKYTALAAKGNPQNGQPLAALCTACHQIGSTGGQIGPNLSGAGAMGLEAVLRNLLTPNAAMEPGYRIYRVELSNGDLVDAFFVSEDTDAVVVRQAGLPDRRIARAEIRSSKFIRRSLMPEGLLEALPDQGAADLLAYLLTLKG